MRENLSDTKATYKTTVHDKFLQLNSMVADLQCICHSLKITRRYAIMPKILIRIQTPNPKVADQCTAVLSRLPQSAPTYRGLQFVQHHILTTELFLALNSYKETIDWMTFCASVAWLM